MAKKKTLDQLRAEKEQAEIRLAVTVKAGSGWTDMGQ